MFFCGGFFFTLNYPTPGGDNRKKNRRAAVLLRFSLTGEGFSRSLRFSVPAAALGFFAGAVEGLVLPGGGKGGSLRVGQGRHHAATLPATVLTVHHGHPHGEQAVIFTAEHAVIHVALRIPRLHGPGLAAQGQGTIRA